MLSMQDCLSNGKIFLKRNKNENKEANKQTETNKQTRKNPVLSSRKLGIALNNSLVISVLLGHAVSSSNNQDQDGE